MIWNDLGLFWAVFGALLLFGLLYNALVAWAERQGYTEGYMSLIVALGVAITLAGLAVLDWRAGLLALLCFSASGAPMIAGSIGRYLRRRAADRQAVLDEVSRRLQQ